MSRYFSALESSGGLSSMAGKELFVSTAESYSSKFLARDGYDVLVRFNTNSNTLQSLAEFGVKHSNAVNKFGFGYLPSIALYQQPNTVRRQGLNWVK